MADVYASLLHFPYAALTRPVDPTPRRRTISIAAPPVLTRARLPDLQSAWSCLKVHPRANCAARRKIQHSWLRRQFARSAGGVSLDQLDEAIVDLRSYEIFCTARAKPATAHARSRAFTLTSELYGTSHSKWPNPFPDCNLLQVLIQAKFGWLGIPQRGGVCGQEPIFAAGSVPFATDDDIRTSSHNGPRPRTETP
jgi:hypothetical protein